MLRPTLVLLSLTLVAPAQVSMTHLGTVDLAPVTTVGNPSFVGTNPVAIAWNGSDLFVAGFNNTGVAGPVGIVRIASALTTPSAGTPFGVVTAPGSRGYSGLDVKGATLLAAYDSGAADPAGITGWDLNGAPLWAKTGRGSSGVDFDPGFGGVDFGAAWATIGSGRRLLQDEVSGADLYTTANGMIVNPTPSPGTTWRDLAFDDATGDIWLRMNNKVIAASRTAGNALVNQRVVVDVPAAIAISQNIAFVRQPADQIVFWNDRPTGGTAVPFATSIQGVRASDGLPVTLKWGSFVGPGGSGIYDFSYDAATRTLAISDFQSKQAFVFRVFVQIDLGGQCGSPGGSVPHLHLDADGGAGTPATFTLHDLDPLAIGCFVFGDVPIFVPLPPYGCPLTVFPLNSIEGVFVVPPGSPGSGVGTLPLVVPPGLTGVFAVIQGLVFENLDLNQLVTSNGLGVILP